MCENSDTVLMSEKDDIKDCAPSKHRWEMKWSGVECKVCGKVECY